VIPLISSTRARDYVTLSILLLTMGECISGIIRYSLLSGGRNGSLSVFAGS
jgi:hypothetical protein